MRPAPCGPPLRGLLRPRPHIRASRALQMWAAGRPPLGFGCGPRIGPGPPAKSRPAGGWTGGCSTVRRFFRPRRGRSLVPSKPPEKGRPDALARARRQRPQDLVEGPGSLQPPATRPVHGALRRPRPRRAHAPRLRSASACERRLEALLRGRLWHHKWAGPLRPSPGWPSAKIEHGRFSLGSFCRSWPSTFYVCAFDAKSHGSAATLRQLALARLKELCRRQVCARSSYGHC